MMLVPVRPVDPEAAMMRRTGSTSLRARARRHRAWRWRAGCARCGARVRVADTRAEPPQRGSAARAHVPRRRARRAARFAGDAARRRRRCVAEQPGPGAAREPAACSRPRRAARHRRSPASIELFARRSSACARTRLRAARCSRSPAPTARRTVTALTGAAVRARQDRRRGRRQHRPAGARRAARRDRARATLPRRLGARAVQLPARDARRALDADAARCSTSREDHLDWHGGMADYAAAKARIFGGGGVQVLNRDDAAIAARWRVPGRAVRHLRPRRAARRRRVGPRQRPARRGSRSGARAAHAVRRAARRRAAQRRQRARGARARAARSACRSTPMLRRRCASFAGLPHRVERVARDRRRRVLRRLQGHQRRRHRRRARRPRRSRWC